MPDLKEFMPHVAPTHFKDDDNNKHPAYLVQIALPNEDIRIFCKDEDSNSDHYDYSIRFEKPDKNKEGWNEPKKINTKKYDGRIFRKKKIVSFIIPPDLKSFKVGNPNICVKIQFPNSINSKDLITHKGTIHFPGD